MSYLPLYSIRAGIVFFGLVGICIGPWILTPISIILLSLRFRSWEALLLGLCMDLTFQPSGDFFHTIPFFTLGAIAVVWLLEPLRRQLLLS